MKLNRSFAVLSLALVAGVYLSACDKPKVGTQPLAEEASLRSGEVTNTPALRTEYARLQGSWVRPDGGYVLEIKSIEPSGVMQASYYNPAPIHVSKALAIREGEDTKVFVELRDARYPGCTYSLKYDPRNDQLYGEYYQAELRETYDVTFGRVK